MLSYGTATAEVTAMLTAAGVSASDDPAVLDLPGVWVTPGQPSMTFDRLDVDIYVGRWDLYLLAPDLDAHSAMDHLSRLVARVRHAFPHDVTEASAVTIQLPNYSPAVPAMLITIDQEVTP